MTSPFAGDLQSFKQATANFIRRADRDGVDPDALERAFRIVALRYLNMTGSPADRAIAVGYYEFAARRLARVVLRRPQEPAPARRDAAGALMALTYGGDLAKAAEDFLREFKEAGDVEGGALGGAYSMARLLIEPMGRMETALERWNLLTRDATQ